MPCHPGSRLCHIIQGMVWHDIMPHAESDLWGQTCLGRRVELLLCFGCAILGRLLNLSELQFLPLLHEDVRTRPTGWSWDFKTISKFFVLYKKLWFKFSFLANL